MLIMCTIRIRISSLTGYREPGAVLFIFKDTRVAAGQQPYHEILFVQPRNALREMWTGRRLGDAGTKDVLGFQQAFNNSGIQEVSGRFQQI